MATVLEQVRTEATKVLTSAVGLKRRMVNGHRYRLSITKQVHVKQIQETEDELTEALMPFFQEQILDASRRLAELGEKSTKHLPSQHGQQSHAGGRGKGGFTTEVLGGNFDAVSQRLLGTKETEDVAMAVGAPDGSHVEISVRGENLEIFYRNDNLGIKARRSVQQDNRGNTIIQNESFHIDKEYQGRGTGTKSFHRQVESASALGVTRIETKAAGRPDSDSNGYYTWLRLGYDNDLSQVPNVRSMIRDKYPKADRLSDVMRTAEDRKWWKENGSTVKVVFDLRGGSQSRRVLDAYIKAKSRKSTGVDGGGRKNTGRDLGFTGQKSADQASSLVGQIYDAGEWYDKLIDRALPVLAKKMGEAAVATWLQVGVDIRKDYAVGVKHLPGGHDQGSHGGGGRGQVGGNLNQDDFKDGADSTSGLLDVAGNRIAARWNVKDSDLHELLKEEGTDAELSGEELKGHAARQFVRKWAGSSGDPVSIAAAVAVSEDIGAPFVLFEGQKTSQQFIKDRPALDRATSSFGKAMYEGTQEWLSRKGVSELSLVRAGGLAEDRAISSWSLSRAGARTETGRSVVRAVIPTKYVLGIPPTGFGTLAESEVVVLARPSGVTRELDSRSSPLFRPHRLKASTATEWLNAQGLEPPPGVQTDLPAWMISSIETQLAETFEQDYWFDILSTTSVDIESFLRVSLTDGLSIKKMASLIKGATGLGFEYYRNRSVNIARTESGNILNGARAASIDALADEMAGQIPMRKSWLSVLGTTTRASHANLDGVPADADGMWELGGVRIPWPAHFSLPAKERCNCQCCPGDLPVRGGFVAGSRVYYDGLLVEFKTVHGGLRVTPNHPVFTSRGMVRADEIKCGDKLLRVEFFQGGKKINDEPALAEQVFKSLESASPSVESCWAQSFHFHGDGVSCIGEVEVVRPAIDFDLVLPSGQEIGDGSLQRALVAQEVSSFGELDFASVGVSEFLRSGIGPEHTRFFQPLLDDATGGVEVFCDLDLRGSGGIHFYDWLSGNVGTVGAWFSSNVERLRPNDNSCFDEFPLDSIFADPHSIHGHTCRVTADDVIDIRVSQFQDHVYDLQTSTQWYTAGDDYAIHNCTVVTEFGMQEEEAQQLIGEHFNRTQPKSVKHGQHDQSSHGRGGGGKKPPKGRTGRRRVAPETPSERTIAEIAKASAVRVAADVQRYSEETNEPQLAKMLGGSSLADNEPMDVVAMIDGIQHGIELKTMTVGKNNKITMKKSAIDRKKAWERKTKAKGHTVVFDDTGVFNAKGEGQHDISQRRIFYRRGYGSFRVGGMHEVTGGADELGRLMNSRQDKLPKGAGGK